MKLRKWLLAGVAALLMLGFALQPVVSLKSAREGLNLFLTVVLPSLLPFMVCANLFIESGAAASAGRLLNPLMRPLFACPGEAAFALTAGLLAGYPTGARIAMDLRDKGLISNEDAQRTGILASSCGPVFMLGAVGAGLLGNPMAGWLIAASHYIAVLLTGFTFSIGGNRTAASARETEAKPLAPAMAAFGASIKKTVDTLWAVGGYIVLFSVVAGLLNHYNALYPLASLAAPLMRLIGLEPVLAKPMLIGAIEMTNGCSAVAASAASLANRCAAMAVLVSFGGFCIQAQSMLFLTEVGLNTWKFALSKTVQAAAAFAICRLLAMLPAFDSALCMGAVSAGGLTAASALLSATIYTAGGMLVFMGLAFVSGRASTRGSAG
jgi:sporulation integral membrane protein YlbJ